MNIESLFRMATDDIMSMFELKEDVMFSKMNRQEITYYINASKNIAKEKVEKLKKEYGNKKLIDICKENDIKVNIVDFEHKVGEIRYRAEICYIENEINIIKPSIELMFEELNKSDLQKSINKALTIEDIIDIHLAHELYHFIEYKEGKDTGDILPKLERFKIFSFKKSTKVVRTSEIAAHIFCKEYLGLSFHPKILDYIYLISTGEVTEEILFDYIKTFGQVGHY